ncbi:reverse transcriptase [Gossypium australe]|uniref:Reverse transcriptase n=1 Tax=Gossypium australe TaxID=47621 RepID=A0A5B6V996_9ROSI|nr:reverse transcriptase [Gossypium australe]
MGTQPCILKSMNDELAAKFKEKEAMEAVKSMAPLKAENVTIERREQVGKVLRVHISGNPKRYLRLPTMVGRRKKNAFTSLKTRFVKWIESWVCVNCPYKEAIPIYTMQCFLFPRSVCHKLESTIAIFSWRNVNTNKGIHWCQWSVAYKPKLQEGFGFMNLDKFNVAFLVK